MGSRSSIGAVASVLLLAVSLVWGGSSDAARAPAPRVPAAGLAPAAPARGVLLVASPGLRDPNFARSVVLLLDYGEGGALGLVINRPLSIRLSRVVADLDGLARDEDRVFLGGPVAYDRILVLIRAPSPPPEAGPVLDGLYASASMDALRAAVREAGWSFRAYAGHAGWAPGQLDAEIGRGDWLLAPGSVAAVFDERGAHELWRELVERYRGRWVRARPGGAQAG